MWRTIWNKRIYANNRVRPFPGIYLLLLPTPPSLCLLSLSQFLQYMEVKVYFGETLEKIVKTVAGVTGEVSIFRRADIKVFLISRTSKFMFFHLIVGKNEKNEENEIEQLFHFFLIFFMFAPFKSKTRFSRSEILKKLDICPSNRNLRVF